MLFLTPTSSSREFGVHGAGSQLKMSESQTGAENLDPRTIYNSAGTFVAIACAFSMYLHENYDGSHENQKEVVAVCFKSIKVFCELSTTN